MVHNLHFKIWYSSSNINQFLDFNYKIKLLQKNTTLFLRVWFSVHMFCQSAYMYVAHELPDPDPYTPVDNEAKILSVAV